MKSFAAHFRNICIGVILIFAIAWVAYQLIPQNVGPAIRISEVGYADRLGWQFDSHGNALLAFRKSCEFIKSLPADTEIPPAHIGGIASDWYDVCDQADATLAEDHAAARAFFENNFSIYSLSVSGNDRGLITGYFEPLIEGSFEQSDEFGVPLYARPNDLVTVNLGLFREDLMGRRVAGRVIDGRLIPFESRREIEAGALNNQGLELLWVKDPVDAFFLHIQGSGRVRLPDGTLQKVGYAGPNGHVYTSIGQLLIERGEIAQEDMSMQAIRTWMAQDPEAARDIMQENASFVFFRLLEGDSPIGAQGVELTPGRSLAVDRAEFPMGAPIWLEGSRPDEDNPTGEPIAFNRLLIAQDTGGAIRGTLRGDVFWGVGNDAEIIAGHMANFSRFYLLLPKTIAATLSAQNN